MNLDAIKNFDLVSEDDNYKLSIKFNRLEQQFDNNNRMIVLFSDVRYTTSLFRWEATLPTVLIPYKDPSTGFLINGVMFSSVGIYQRAPGVVLSSDQDNAATGKERLDIITSHNTVFSLVYRRHGVNILFKRGGKDKVVPIGVFLKAFSGLPYSVILDRFAFCPPDLRNSFPCRVSVRGVDLATTPAYGINSDEEPSVEDCIDIVYRALSNYEYRDKSEEPSYSPHWKLNRIRSYMNNMEFKSEQNYETVMSLHARAVGTYADEDLVLPIFQMDGEDVIETTYTLSRGTYIDETIAEELSWYNVKCLRVRTERSLLLQEETPYLFRVKGYMLVNNIPEAGLTAGTVLGETELRALNRTNIKMLEFDTPEGRKIISRSGDTLDIGDFYTMLNMLFISAYRSFDESSQYELANRVVVDYNRQVFLEVEQTYQDIAEAILGADSLESVTQSLPKLPSNRLSEHLRDTSSRELAQAEITNIMSRAIAEGRTSALMRETPQAMTQIQLGQYARIDSLHSPESDKVGSVQELTAMARVNSLTGEIEAPYERVENGVPTGVIRYISASKEKNKYIASWNEDFSSETIMARYNGNITTVSKYAVDYRDASPFCDMSISRATIPFPEFSQPRRSLMASKMAGQAVPLLYPERPLISTGADLEVPCLYYTAREIVISSLGEDAVVEGVRLSIVNVRWEKFFAFYTCLFNGVSFQYSIPFTATDKNTLYNYNLNYKEDGHYCLDDIVFFNQSCDISNVELKEFINQGTLPLIGTTDRPSLALGVNLRVM